MGRMGGVRGDGVWVCGLGGVVWLCLFLWAFGLVALGLGCTFFAI